MITTCGVFFFNPDKQILICHPTYHSITSWTIPKGVADEEEDYKVAAFRELKEETGISVEDYTGPTFQLGFSEYKHGNKRLSGYAFFSNRFVNHELKCESMVEPREHQGNVPFPEIDQFEWVEFEIAMVKLHYTQQELLNKLDRELSLP